MPRRKGKSNILRRLMGKERDEPQISPPAPPSYTSTPETMAGHHQGPGISFDFMQKQKAAPQYPVELPSSKPTPLATQLLQVQAQLQQVQQMMHRMMVSGKSSTTSQVYVRYATAPPTHQPINNTNKMSQSLASESEYLAKMQKQAHPTTARRLACSVCMLTKNFVPWGHAGKSDFPQHNLTAKCGHESSVCTQCLSSWIGVQLESKGWKAICCPQCPNTLEHNVVKKFATPDVFKRYEKEESRATLKLLSNFRYCVGHGCDSGQEHTPGADSPRMTCISCGQHMCFNCDVAWHRGYTCAEFQKKKSEEMCRRHDEAASLEWIKKNTIRCPSCKIPIEVTGGCDHLTCRCRHEWCRECGKDWRDILKGGHEYTCHSPMNMARW